MGRPMVIATSLPSWLDGFSHPNCGGSSSAHGAGWHCLMMMISRRSNRMVGVELLALAAAVCRCDDWEGCSWPALVVY